MIIANEVVADISWLKVPFIYRVHEIPDSEKDSRITGVL